MSDTLSKDEVDALLRGVNDGDVAVEEKAPPRGTVTPYDLVGDERLTQRRFPTLEQMHERFLRRLRATLATVVGTPPVLELGRFEILKWQTLRNRLASGLSLHLFTMPPLRGQALLAVSGPLAFGLIDRICGGSGRPAANAEGREYSAIEMQMIQRLVARLLADLAEAWAPVQRLECRFLRSELTVAHLAFAAAGDMITTLELQCDLGTGAAPLVLAVPYATLEPVLAKLDEPKRETVAGDREWQGAFAGAVRQAEVTVSAELATRDTSTREVLALKVGDILALDARSDDPVALRAEGVPLLVGLAGVSRGQNAVRILGRGTTGE